MRLKCEEKLHGVATFKMKSAKIFVLFLLLPIVTVETGIFDFFNVFYDVLRPFDSKEFENDLRKTLFGQHIALETILKAVSWFMKDPNPLKPLVLSLHGPTGVGKSFVTKIIARNIYEMGIKSKHVHTIIASHHFPRKDQLTMYEDQLKQWIYKAVSSFPRSMFIFDEMESMNPHLINTMKPFLDYNIHVDGVSYRNAIFIFLSNAGQQVINNLVLDFWREGQNLQMNLQDLQMNTKEMETQIYQEIFNDKHSGFWHSCIIDEYLVDHFIPFLPLEQKHVHQCVQAEMTNLNITVDHELIDRVLKNMPFFPPEEKIFSVKGCKTIKQKLMLHSEL